MRYVSDGSDRDEKPRQSVLRVVVHGDPPMSVEHVCPEGPATWVVGGDRWVSVPRGSTKIVLVLPGTEVRLVGEDDLRSRSDASVSEPH